MQFHSGLNSRIVYCGKTGCGGGLMPVIEFDLSGHAIGRDVM